MADPCAECKHAKVPNAWGCAACGRIIEQPMLAENKKLRADLAAATNSREHFLSELLAEQEACKGWRLKYEAEQRAHAENRSVLESRIRELDADLSCAVNGEEMAREELARLNAELERSRYKGCGSYPRAIGEIEAALGITGTPPLGETVEAVRRLASARPVLAALANATIERLSNGWEMLDGDSNRAVSAAELARLRAQREGGGQ